MMAMKRELPLINLGLMALLMVLILNATSTLPLRFPTTLTWQDTAYHETASQDKTAGPTLDPLSSVQSFIASLVILVKTMEHFFFPKEDPGIYLKDAVRQGERIHLKRIRFVIPSKDAPVELTVPHLLRHVRNGCFSKSLNRGQRLRWIDISPPPCHPRSEGNSK